MTFTLDDDAVRQLDRAAARLDVPKSHVVREALHVYGEHIGRLTDEERAAKLEAFDRLVPAIPHRARAEVDAEIERVRADRRGGGRATRSS